MVRYEWKTWKGEWKGVFKLGYVLQKKTPKHSVALESCICYTKSDIVTLSFLSLTCRRLPPDCRQKRSFLLDPLPRM